jgi:hypothetical protein
MAFPRKAEKHRHFATNVVKSRKEQFAVPTRLSPTYIFVSRWSHLLLTQMQSVFHFVPGSIMLHPRIRMTNKTVSWLLSNAVDLHGGVGESGLTAPVDASVGPY